MGHSTNPTRYELPQRKRTTAESVYILNWVVYDSQNADTRQHTTYAGTQQDLIDLGLAPAQIFSDFGKYVKSGRVEYQGKNVKLELKRAKAGMWAITWSCAGTELPYESEKARRTQDNGYDSDMQQAAQEVSFKKLEAETGYKSPSLKHYDGLITAITYPSFDSAGEITNLRTLYTGTRIQLVNACLATESMFSGGYKKSKKDGWRIHPSIDDEWTVEYTHDIFSMPEDLRKAARDSAKREFLDHIKKFLKDD